MSGSNTFRQKMNFCLDKKTGVKNQTETVVRCLDKKTGAHWLSGFKNNKDEPIKQLMDKVHGF